MDTGNLLGEFLRARRNHISPKEAGLDHYTAARRRTPGLRREEVAMLAGVSTDYYVRLEQGRERRPSSAVLGALARVLRLTPEAKEHLYDLVLRPDRPRRTVPVEGQASPNLVRLMGACTTTPAIICNRWLDVVALNPIAEILCEGLTPGDNLLNRHFIHPHARRFFRNWEEVAHSRVAYLRATAGVEMDDPRLSELVARLSDGSPEFHRIWRRHEVGGLPLHTKHLRHPEVGDMTITCDGFFSPGVRGQQLITMHTEPGSPSERAINALVEIAAAAPPAKATIE